MTTVCLVVLTIAGSWCYDNAPLIGDCVPAAVTGVYNCVARPQDFAVFVSAYDPVYCLPEIVGSDYEPTNCYDDPMYTGSGGYVPEWYSDKPCLPGGKCGISCPLGWNWKQVTIADIGTFRCIDSGDGIVPGYKLVTRWVYDTVAGAYLPQVTHKWVITLDVLYPVYRNGWPTWALLVYDKWHFIAE